MLMMVVFAGLLRNQLLLLLKSSFGVDVVNNFGAGFIVKN